MEALGLAKLTEDNIKAQQRSKHFCSIQNYGSPKTPSSTSSYKHSYQAFVGSEDEGMSRKMDLL